jgi:hypothetical protein
LRTLTTDLFLTSGNGTRVLYPESVVAFTYTFTNLAGTYVTNISTRGAPDNADAPTVVTNGEKTVQVATMADSKTQFRQTYDISSGQLTDQQTYCYFGTSNRSFSITYLDGSVTTNLYSDCRNLLVSTSDRDGVTTDHIYDFRKREVATQRLGIVLSNVLDAAGNTIETWRFPTSGNPVRLSTSTYDTAGRLRSSADALNRSTWTGYTFDGNGRFVTSTTNADGSWRQELQNRDGTTYRILGSAAFPLQYVYGLDEASGELVSTETKLGADGLQTSEWTRRRRGQPIARFMSDSTLGLLPRTIYRWKRSVL